jgi:hypothetical protein
MRDSTPALPNTIECPLCSGKGELTRSEMLERLGMKDYARIAELSAQEAIRLLLVKEEQDEQGRWIRFESELARRIAEATTRHNAEVQKLQVEKSQLAADKKLAEEQKDAEVAKARAELEAALSSEKAKANDLDRKAQDYLQEITSLRERNHTLESEMAKIARIGRKEEIDFAEEARSWKGVVLGEKLRRNGDYLLAFADGAANPLEPWVLVENKDKPVCQADIRKLVRDAKGRGLAAAALVVRDESQLRHVDRQRRWAQQDGIWLLRSARAWLPRDLEVLRPVFERMRTEGPGFLQRNAALADEVRRTLADIDEIEGQLQKAGAADEKAQSLTASYRARLAMLCDSANSCHPMPCRPNRKNGKPSADNRNEVQDGLPGEGGAVGDSGV